MLITTGQKNKYLLDIFFKLYKKFANTNLIKFQQAIKTNKQFKQTMTYSNGNYLKLNSQKLSDFNKLQSFRAQLVKICYFI